MSIKIIRIFMILFTLNTFTSEQEVKIRIENDNIDQQYFELPCNNDESDIDKNKSCLKKYGNYLSLLGGAAVVTGSKFLFGNQDAESGPTLTAQQSFAKDIHNTVNTKIKNMLESCKGSCLGRLNNKYSLLLIKAGLIYILSFGLGNLDYYLLNAYGWYPGWGYPFWIAVVNSFSEFIQSFRDQKNRIIETQEQVEEIVNQALENPNFLAKLNKLIKKENKHIELQEKQEPLSATEQII